MGKHVAWRVAALAVVLSAAACNGGTNLEGDAPDGRPDVDGEAEADACVPACAGRECGEDGCGGVCLPGCGEGELCRTPPGECLAGRGWVEVPSRLAPPLTGGAMAFDASRGVVVLFVGGSGRTGYLDDTWEYDGTTWTEVATPDSPSGRQGHAMAYDSARDVVVLFGGFGADGVLADTWEYDGTLWTKVVTPAAPPASTGHAMVYDSVRGVVVLLSAGYTLAISWEYDGITWRQVVAPRSPPDRGEFAIAYDSARDAVVLFGGQDPGGAFLGDTWEYYGP